MKESLVTDVGCLKIPHYLVKFLSGFDYNFLNLYKNYCFKMIDNMQYRFLTVQ